MLASSHLEPDLQPVIVAEGQLLDLLECALARCFVWPPPQEFCSVPEAVASDMVEANLDDQLRLYRLPFTAALGAPTARTARRLAGETRPVAQLLEFLGKSGTLVIGDSGGEADVVQQSFVVVETKQ